MDVNQIFFLGHNKYGQAGIGEDQHNKKYLQPKQIVFKTFIKQVSCGNHHSALLTIDGLIYTMGSNIHGTLGLGNSGNINYAFKPTLVKDIKDVDQVISGSYHMCAIKQGELYTWGKGIDGQLGHGNMKNLFVPTKVQAFGNDVQSVSCGMNHTLVLVSNKSNDMNGYAFGSGIYGQLGCGTNRSYNYPVSIKLPNIEVVSAGQNHSLFISDGKIFGSGDNSCLQIGNFEDSTKNKKYVLQPSKLDYFTDDQISLVDCYNLSVALTSRGKVFTWGGKAKLWPPMPLEQTQILNIKVTNEKVYYINGDNQLISLIPQSSKGIQSKQIIISNRNILDFDVGQNHVLAVGDIIAQIEEKMYSSHLSVWTGQSLTCSKLSFSRQNTSNKNGFTKQIQNQNNPVNQQIPDFYFTMHLKSGMTEEPDEEFSSKKDITFESAEQLHQDSGREQSLIQTHKTFQNMSSSIEVEGRNPFNINESETQRNFQNNFKVENKVLEVNQNINIVKNQLEVDQTKTYTENKLQKLMDQMESKTIHLKKHFLGMGKQQKTPCSHIKKEPQNFVVQSQRVIGNSAYEKQVAAPRISQFQQRPNVRSSLKEKDSQNILKSKEIVSKKEDFQLKNKAKSFVYLDEKQNFIDEQNQSIEHRREMPKNKAKNGDSAIQNIFMQLLKKQKQKGSDQKIGKSSFRPNVDQLPPRRNRSSVRCTSSQIIYPETSRMQKQSTKVFHNPLSRSPFHENKMTISKISERSNISAKTNTRKNSDLLEITRSNRQLRFRLRDRDFKISQLQEDLSKKQIQVQMLSKQIEQFKSMSAFCKDCGSERSMVNFFSNA